VKEIRDKVVVNIFPSFATWLRKKNKSMLQCSEKSSQVFGSPRIPTKRNNYMG